MQPSTLPAATQSAPSFPMRLYTVAWTGGLEQPSFGSYTDIEVAREKFAEWKTDGGGVGDRVSLIEHTVEADGTVVNVCIEEWTAADEDSDEG